MATANSTTKRVAGYCRTSGEGQRDNTSIPNQRAEIEALCKQSGWKPAHYYVDEAKSGGKIAGRDSFQQMMKDAANGRFDVVVVFDISRFARDGFDIIDSARTLKRDFSIDVVDTKNQFDTRDHRRTMSNFIHAGLSENERLTIMDRMIGGKIARAKEGRPWSSCPPVGRAYDKATGKWHVTDKGRAIAEVLRRYLQGESLKILCAEHGISRTAKVSEYVLHGQLSGQYVATFNSPDIGIAQLQVPVPGVPEVVPSAVVEKAKARLKHNRTFNRHDVRRYALSGFVRCAECSKALTGQARDDMRYYRHPTADCSVRSVRADEIEGAVLDYLYQAFLDQPTFDEAVRKAMPTDKDRRALEKERADAEKRLTAGSKSLERLVDAVAKGVDPDLLIAKQDRIKEELVAAAKRIEALDAELATMPSPEHAQRAAMLTRLLLTEEHKAKDWRKLPHDAVKRFLLHLFGETTPTSGTGIFIARDAEGNAVITFRGKVDFHHLVANGRPVSKAVQMEADRLNAEIQRALKVDKPSPGDCSPGAPTDPYVHTLEHTVPQDMGSLLDV